MPFTLSWSKGEDSEEHVSAPGFDKLSPNGLSEE